MKNERKKAWRHRQIAWRTAVLPMPLLLLLRLQLRLQGKWGRRWRWKLTGGR